MGNGWYSKKWTTVAIHVLAWIILFSLPALLFPAHNPNEARENHAFKQTTVFFIARTSDILLIGFFYLNAFLLIPAFLYKRKYLPYGLSLTAYYAVYVVVMWLLWSNLTRMDITFAPHATFSLLIFIFILACSMAYKTIRDKFIHDRIANEKETEHLKTELSLLRSQASPHFMFNVLNNMVSLARKKSDDLEPSLIKFAALMRYMIYETDESKVSLENETEYLQSYIDLQQQRLSKKTIVVTDICAGDQHYEIDPMLLIPFVENAFKHGTGFVEDPKIEIKLSVENNVLHFRVSNRYNEHSRQIKDKARGIGLTNVQRRLELLHPGSYKLEIKKHDNLFVADLSINLNYDAMPGDRR